MVHDELHPTETNEEEAPKLQAASSLDEDFIDWKLKYETIEKQNQQLRSRLDSEIAPIKSPKSSQPTFEFKSQYELLEEQNELLRAQLGAHGIVTERSLEGDVLDPKVHEDHLQRENEEMKQKMKEVDQSVAQSNETFNTVQIQQLRQRVSEIQAQNAELQQENDELHKKLSLNGDPEVPREQLMTSQQENKDLVRRIVELEAELEDFRSVSRKNEELVMKIENLEASLESMASTVESSAQLREDNEELCKRIEELRDESDAKERRLTEENEKLDKNVSELQAESNVKEENYRKKLEELECGVKSNAKLQEENENLNKRVEELNKKVIEDEQTFQMKYQELEKECEKLRTEINSGLEVPQTQDSSSLNDQLKQLQQENNKLQEDLSSYKLQIEAFTEAEVSLKQEKTEAEKTRDKAKKDSTKLKAKLLAANKENEKLQSKLASLEGKAVEKEALQQAAEDIPSSRSSMSSVLSQDTTVSEMEQQLEDVKEQNTKLIQEKQELQEQNQGLHKEKQDLEQQLSLMFEKPSASAESPNKKLQTKLQKLEKQHKKLQEDHEALKKTRAVTSSDYDSQELERENSELKAEIDKLKEWNDVEIQEVKENTQSLEKTVTDLRKQLKATEDGKSSLTGSLEDITAQYRELSQQFDTTKQTLDTVLSECESSKVRLAEVLTSNEELSVQNERLKKELSKHSVSEAADVRLTPTMHDQVDSSVTFDTNLVNVDKRSERDGKNVISEDSKSDDRAIDPNVNVTVGKNQIDEGGVMERIGAQSQSSDQVVQISPDSDHVTKELYEKTLRELHDLQTVHETLQDENRGLLYEVERLETDLADVQFQFESKSNGTASDIGLLSDQGSVIDVQTVEPSGQPLVSLIEPVVPLTEPSVRPIATPVTSTPVGKRTRGRGKARESLAPRKGVRVDSPVPKPKHDDSTPKPKQAQNKRQSTQPEKAASKTPQRAQTLREAELKKQIEKLQKDNRSLVQKAESLSKTEAELARLKKRSETMRKEKRDLQAHLETCNKEKRDLQTRLDREISHHGSSASLASVSSSKGKKEKKDKPKKHDKEITELRQQVQQKEHEKDELLNIIRQSGQAPADLAELKMQFEILLAEKKNMIAKFEEEKAKLTEDIHELTERAELLEREKAEMVEQDVEKLTSRSGTDVNMERMAQHLEKLSSEVRESHEEKEKLEEKCEQLAKEKREAVSKVMTDMIQLQQRVNDLTTKTEVLERERDEAKSEYQALLVEKDEISSEFEVRLKSIEEENAELLRERPEAQEIQGSISTPPQRPQDTTSTQSQKPSDPASTPPQRPQDTTSTPPQRPQGTSTPPQRPRSSSSLLSINIPSPGSTTRSQSPSVSVLSQNELSIQNELLLVEKRQLCAKLEESEGKVKELHGTVRQLGLQAQRFQQDVEQTKQEAESQKIQIQLIMDEKKEVCGKLTTERGRVKDLKLKCATMSKQVITMEHELQRLKSRAKDPKGAKERAKEPESQTETVQDLQEQKSLLEMQLEKVEQDLRMAHKETEETRVQYETSMAETKEKTTALELHLAKERSKSKAVREELEEVSFRYEELRIQTQRSSSSEASPREAKDVQKDLLDASKDPASQDLLNKDEVAGEISLETSEETAQDLQIHKLETDLENVKKPYDLLVQDYTELSQKYQDVSGENSNLRTQVSALESEVTRLQEELRHIKDERDQIEVELTKVKKDLEDLSHENDLLKLDASEKDIQMLEENARLKEALDDCVTGRARLREQVAQLEEELKQMKSRHERDSEEMEKLTDEIDGKEDELDQKVRENKKLRDCLEQKEAEADRLRLQVEEMSMEKPVTLSKAKITHVDIQNNNDMVQTNQYELLESGLPAGLDVKLQVKFITHESTPKDEAGIEKKFQNVIVPQWFIQRAGLSTPQCYSATCASNLIKMAELVEHGGKTQDVAQTSEAKVAENDGKTDVAQTSEADMSLADLQEENNRLYKLKMELEDQIMTKDMEKNELQKVLDEKDGELAKKTEELEHEISSMKSMAKAVQEAKEELEEDMLRQREEFEDKLARLRLNSLEKHVKDQNARERIVTQISEAEKKVLTLQDKLRAAQEEKNLMQLKITHHGRECKLYERHIQDLEKEVDVQQAQIQEAMSEHKETIQMLAEMRLQQDTMRQLQSGEWSRIDGKLQSLESQISSSILSTPYSMSFASVSRAESTTSVFDEVRDRANTAESGEDPGYKSQPDSEESLQKELKETKEKYEKEIEALQSQLREVTLHSMSSPIHLDQQFSSPLDQPLFSPGSSSADQSYQLSAEMLTLRECLLTLETVNRHLQEENAMLQTRVEASQIEMVTLYEHLEKCSCMDDNKGIIESIFGNQLALLQSQNASLHHRVKELSDYASQNAALLQEKGSLEEKLRREKELVRQKTHDKEKAEIELLRERIFLEKQIKEYQKLEDLMHEKETHERELRGKIAELKELYESDKSEMTDSGISGTTGLVDGTRPRTRSKSDGVSIMTDSGIRIESPELDGIISKNRSKSDDTQNTSQNIITTHTDTLGKTTQKIEYVGLKPEALQHEQGKLYVEIRRKMRYRDVRTQVGESALRDPSVPDAADSLASKVRTSKAFKTSGKWTKLDCGCVAELETQRMYSHCKYHQAVAKLRKDLKRAEAKKRSMLGTY